jgi:hypothetical protein
MWLYYYSNSVSRPIDLHFVFLTPVHRTIFLRIKFCKIKFRQELDPPPFWIGPFNLKSN